MNAWLPGTLLLDIVIACSVLEAACLYWRWRRGQSRLRPEQFLAGIAAGLALMLAFRLNAQPPLLGMTAPLLALAGLMHLLDLRLRSRSPDLAGNWHRQVSGGERADTVPRSVSGEARSGERVHAQENGR
jgi:hypothetical protein